MADNIELDIGAGGAVVKTDEDGSSWHWQYVKTAYGADGTQTRVTATNGLPIQGDGTDLPITLDGETVVLGASDGTDIGNVDVASNTPGTAAGNLGKAVDAVAGGGDTGVAVLAVRDDALGGITPAAGDYGTLLIDANGALWTHDDVLEACVSGSEMQVDIVAALPAGTNAIGKLAANSGVDIGDVDVTSVPAPLNVTGGGTEAAALRVTLANDSTGVVSVDDGGGTLTVDGTVTANLSATDNAVLDNIDSNTDYGAVVGGGAEATALRVTVANDSTGVLSVDDNGGSLTVDNADITTVAGAVSGSEMQVDVVAALPAGANAIGKLAANSGVDIGDVDVTSISAGTNTIGGVIAMPSVSTAYDGTTSTTIKRASGLAASGTVEMVAAVPGYQIRVLALSVTATNKTTATNVYVHNDDNDLYGDASNPIPISNDADGDHIPGLVLGWNPGGWFQTDTDNESLDITLSAAQDVAYAVTYVEVT